jgi:hypothetical protein
MGERLAVNVTTSLLQLQKDSLRHLARAAEASAVLACCTKLIISEKQGKGNRLSGRGLSRDSSRSRRALPSGFQTPCVRRARRGTEMDQKERPPSFYPLNAEEMDPWGD